MKKRLIIKLYNLLGLQRCKKSEPLKPMGIRSSYYPDGYVAPVKRTFSDGTTEYFIPIEAQKNMDEALANMKKESIIGKSNV